MLENVPNPYNREKLGEKNLQLLQEIVNLLAEAFNVPAAYMLRVDGETIEVFMANEIEGNPFKAGDNACFPGSGFYCEWAVRNERHLHVADANKDPEWQGNPGAELGLVSYMGVPVNRPDGKIFGTICVLDTRENQYSEVFLKLLYKFKAMVELMLTEVQAQEEIVKRDEYLCRISKIFPICSYCKSIRNGENVWVSAEKYIGHLSGQVASHGICPECMKREFGEG